MIVAVLLIPQLLSPCFMAVMLNLLEGLKPAHALGKEDSIKFMLHQFSSSRNYEKNPSNLNRVRDFIKDRLEYHGYRTWLESVTVGKHTGFNVIGRLNGRYSNTRNDRILIIGAHYDSYQTSSGVDDNGSGLAALLQVAQRYSSQDCKRNSTIVFVAFDLKECQTSNSSDPYKYICSFGSRNFIKNLTDYLGPNNTRGSIQGAVILDSIMNFDWRKNAQRFPSEVGQYYGPSVKHTVEEIASNGNRGDFLLTVGRDDGDRYLLGNFTKYYKVNGQLDQDKFLLKTFKFNLQQRPSTLGDIARHNLRHLWMGDHYRFWDNDPIVNAIFLTDTADFRGYMKHCYHSNCDVISHVTLLRTQFMVKTADTLDMMARKMTGLGNCVNTPAMTKEFDANSGQFQSHGYPRRYHNNADITWIITVDYGHVIELWFTDFVLELNDCKSDYVDVFDGWSNYTKHIGRYCGTNNPTKSTPITTTGRHIRVHFKSDILEAFKGFRARWKAKKDLNAARALEDVQSIQYFLKKFNVSRNAEYSKSKDDARNLIKTTLEKQGYRTWLEYFDTNGYAGKNVVARKSGHHTNNIKDRIFIVGAHYDTYKASPGVDDNGSGLAAMLQVARQYSDEDQECEQNFTIVFVAFDRRECKSCKPEDRYEESCRCSYGSQEFIKNFTKYLGKNSARGKIQGSVIMESIMNFDPTPNAQNFSEELRERVDQSVTKVVKQIDENDERGDFLLAVGRDDGDKYLLGNFTKYYTQGEHYTSRFKLRKFTWTLQEQPSRLTPMAKYNYRHLFAGDHYRFWNNDPIVNAIYLTDTADFRGYMKYCYHNDCDDFSHVTPDRLKFVANTANAVYMMARRLTGLGECVATLFGNVSKNLYSTSGEFESPGYPDHYPNNADSVWYLTVPSGFRVELRFTDFQLEKSECINDYVNVYDGFKSGKRLLGHYCGTKLPNNGNPIRSTGRYMKVLFRSDSYDTFKGFEAKWKAKGTVLQSTSFSLLCIISILVYLWT